MNPIRIALFGGLYSNYLALEEAIRDAKSLGVDEMHCLGDMGAFGPFPDRVFPLIHEHQILCLQGNYDDSIGHQLDDCQCGYTDPRDNYFAQISYDYTLANTSDENREFLRGLPPQRRVKWGDCRAWLCHGSPRRVNEFLWESTTPTPFLDRLIKDEPCDLLAVTHTGVKWQRELPGERKFVNVGVLGRPENDGNTNVWYTLLTVNGRRCEVEFRPIAYDHHRLAAEMGQEGLPSEFIETVISGWWTTCLEVLPARERAQGVF